MGYTSANDMAAINGVNEVTLSWHLTSNHFPPHDPAMIPVAMQAIEAFNDEDYERLIDLPKIVTYRGRSTITAAEAVDGLHLEAFLGGDDDEPTLD